MIKWPANSLGYRLRNLEAFMRYFRLEKSFVPKDDLILLFHGIDTTGNQRYNVRFTSQSDFLYIVKTLRRHYHICQLRDLGSPSDVPRLVVTFDDGYRNWKTHLLPLLEKYGIPVTLFITMSEMKMLWTDRYDIFRYHYSLPLRLHGQLFTRHNGRYQTSDGVELNKFLKSSGCDAISDFHRAAFIEPKVLTATRNYWELLSADDISDLSESPWVEIGSHCCTHTSLDRLSDESLRYELTESRNRLSRITGTTVRSLAFPSGRYDGRVVRFSREAGYEVLLAEDHILPDFSDASDLLRREGIYSMGSKYLQLVLLLEKLNTAANTHLANEKSK